MNQVILIGNIGKGIEYTGGDNPRAKFSIATNKKVKGEKVTTWHNVIAWGKTAEVLNTFATSGTRLMVCGELAYNDYEKDGVKQRYAQVVCREFEFVGGKQQNGENVQPQPHAPSEELKQRANEFFSAMSNPDTDSNGNLPF